MNKNSIILICSIIIILFIVLVLLYMCSKYKKVRRVLDFSLEDRNGSTFFEKILFEFSDFLESLVIFNGVSRTYDQFIFDDSRLRKGMDYIAIKVILAILCTLFYYFIALFYIGKIYITLVVAAFALGLVIVDFYCLYRYYQKTYISHEDYMKLVIMINNGFKASKSVESILEECIRNTSGSLRKQVRTLLRDYRMGLSLQKSFERMYYRVSDRSILFISNCLKLYDEGVSYSVIFPYVEKELVKYEKITRKINDIKEFNLMLSIFFVFIPIVFIVYVLFSKNSYVDGILSNYGFAILLIEMIIYLLYLLFVRVMLKGRYV